MHNVRAREISDSGVPTTLTNPLPPSWLVKGRLRQQAGIAHGDEVRCNSPSKFMLGPFVSPVK